LENYPKVLKHISALLSMVFKVMQLGDQKKKQEAFFTLMEEGEFL